MRALAVTLLIASIPAAAELVVVYDSGQSAPIDEFLAPLLDGPSVPAPQEDANDEVQDDLLATLLPLRPARLRPGALTPRRVERAQGIALFVIGADPMSLAWLRHHRQALIAHRAHGLLVEAANLAAVTAVADAAAGLPIAPVPDNALAELLDVDRYPFAITEGRLWQ